jgi:hypothetical protein
MIKSMHWTPEDIDIVTQHMYISTRIKRYSLILDVLMDEIYNKKRSRGCIDLHMRLVKRKAHKCSKFENLRCSLESLLFEQVEDKPFYLHSKKMYLTNVYFSTNDWLSSSVIAGYSLDDCKYTTDNDKEVMKRFFSSLLLFIFDVKHFLKLNTRLLSGKTKNRAFKHVNYIIRAII